MKKIIAIMMVTALVTGAAFARGSNENESGKRRGTGMMTSGDSVVLAGTVEEMEGRVVLNSPQGFYSLSAPGFYRAGVEIPYGETIEVIGNAVNEPCDDCDLNADGHIFVESVVLEGETLTFDSRGGNQGGSGRNDNRNSRRGNGGRNSSGRSGGQNGRRYNS